MKINRKQGMIIAILGIIAMASLVWLLPLMTSVEFHAGNLSYLDEKINNVLALTASTTALSTALTFLPGDVATPIAEQLVDYNSYFMIILCGVYLEKYLLTLTNYLTFGLFIPLSCGIGIVKQFFNKEAFSYFSRRLAIFGMIIILIIPASIYASKIIDDTYSFSVENITENAEEITNDAQEESVKENESWLGGIVGSVQEGIYNMTEGVSDTVEDAQNFLSHLVEGIAIMLITSCVIPVLVFVAFIYVMKLTWGVHINVPKLPKKQKENPVKKIVESTIIASE